MRIPFRRNRRCQPVHQRQRRRRVPRQARVPGPEKRVHKETGRMVRPETLASNSEVDL